MAKPKFKEQVFGSEMENKPNPEATAMHGKKGGRSVAGKDLSDSRSSSKKGRKSSTTPKKLEQAAE